MSGQNTHKQITAMVILMFFGVASLGAYVWFDDGRRSEAEDQHLIESAERGAPPLRQQLPRLPRQRRRRPHRPRPQHAPPTPSPSAPPTPARSARLRPAPRHHRVRSQRHRHAPLGRRARGSLNFFHIESLVTLVTTNSGNRWEEALALAIEHDEASLQSLESVSAAATAGATAQGIANAVNAAVDDAAGDLDLALRGVASGPDPRQHRRGGHRRIRRRARRRQAAQDEDALDALELQIDERQAELLDALVAASLDEADGDAEVALIEARAAIAELAAETALATLEPPKPMSRPDARSSSRPRRWGSPPEPAASASNRPKSGLHRQMRTSANSQRPASVR